MTDKEKTRIEKFLEIHFGNLEMSEKRQGLYKSLGHKDDNSTIFLIGKHCTKVKTKKKRKKKIKLLIPKEGIFSFFKDTSSPKQKINC